MNKNAEKWVQALESGEYKQRMLTLGSPERGYCCLGLACKIYEDETGEQLPKRDQGNDYSGQSLNWDFKIVSDWLNLKQSAQLDLIDLNDVQGKSFQQIAKIIKTNQREIFKR